MIYLRIQQTLPTSVLSSAISTNSNLEVIIYDVYVIMNNIDTTKQINKAKSIMSFLIMTVK